MQDLDVAFLMKIQSEPTLYYALHSRIDPAPTSAVVRLIQGIYATEPDQSRILVRNRIYTTAHLTTMDRGIIAVAAKRATDRILENDKSDRQNFEELVKIPSRRIDLTQTENGLSAPLSYEHHSHRLHPARDETSWMELANQLTQTTLAQRENKAPLFLSDRPVAAILVSKTGELLDWALNTNAVNKTLHAELNLVQSFYRKFKSKLPAGAKLYTTLKPCKMCAAFITDAAEDIRTLEVIYDEDDLGTNARNTTLEKTQRKLVRSSVRSPHNS